MNDRVAHCHLVASVLAADGKITGGERDFLKRAMERFELSEAERDAVLHFEGVDDALEHAKKMDPELRKKIVDELVTAALVDGELSPLEMAVVKKLTDALGLKSI